LRIAQRAATPLSRLQATGVSPNSEANRTMSLAALNPLTFPFAILP